MSAESLMGKSVLVTGGAGFLGSHFVKAAISDGAKVVNVDALTYAGDLARLSEVESDPGYTFVELDITEPRAVRRAFADHRPELVAHFAAETHVTRSETDPQHFLKTNVEGTRNVIEAAIESGSHKIVHISTDEVYGSIEEGGFKETDKIAGINEAAPGYATSKAEADDLALSLADRIAVTVARPTNAFGPTQFPEKAFPRWVTRALRGESIPVWGDGLYVRQWLYAKDLARAVALLLEKGEPGEAYNIGPHHDPEITNITLARWIADHLGLDPSTVEMTAYDRPHHDRRYSVDSSKLRSLGWEPGDVWDQFAETVAWYRDNQDWWSRHIAEAESIYHDVS